MGGRMERTRERMAPRIERAKQIATLGVKTLGVAGTIAVLAALWFALHAAEREFLASFDDVGDE